MSKSSTTTKQKLLPVITPGEVLREEFMKPYGLSANGLAIALRVPASRLLAILNEGRAITADTALRLAQYFGNTPHFWMNLQSNYDLEKARREKLGEIQATVQARIA